MDERGRTIGRREAIDLHAQINTARELITEVENKLGREASVSPEEWEKLKDELNITIEALSGLKEMGILIEEQKALLTKLESQWEYLDRVIGERKKERREAA